MNIERISGKLKWGALDVNLFGAVKDWYGKELEHPVGFSFAIDEDRLWFIATHAAPASLHPDARPNRFTRELWKYDCAEFFLTNPQNGRYLEFNLSPNGAWWAAEFSAPREGMGEAPLQGVETYAQIGDDGSWLAAASFDLLEMHDRFSFGPDSTLNAAFILNSPEQQFISLAELDGDEPDFHQPEKFKKANFFQASDLSV